MKTKENRKGRISVTFIGTVLALCVTLPAIAIAADDVKAFVGARIIDGTGNPPMEKATLVIRNDKIEAVGTKVKVPAGAQRINAAGMTIIPGLVSAHSHVSSAEQLKIYLRYGITTIWSLGDSCEGPAKKAGCTSEFDLREQSRHAAPGTLPRLYVAGPVVVAKTPEEARKVVDELITHKPDVVKFREDGYRGVPSRMGPDVYSAIIDEAHKNGFRAASHIITLEDAKGVLKAGSDFIAHSVRDQLVDDEFIQLMKARNVPYCPTFTRELSTFIYSEVPAFFKDPFFLKEADPAEVAALQDPKFQEHMRNDKSGQWFKDHFDIALQNLKKVSDAGITIAMGTDSGAPRGRWEGYFEQVELEYEAKAGLTPMQVLVSATSSAAKAIGVGDKVGSLKPGMLADVLVLSANPLDDIKNTRKIVSIWQGGAPVALKREASSSAGQ